MYRSTDFFFLNLTLACSVFSNLSLQINKPILCITNLCLRPSASLPFQFSWQHSRFGNLINSLVILWQFHQLYPVPGHQQLIYPPDSWIAHQQLRIFGSFSPRQLMTLLSVWLRRGAAPELINSPCFGHRIAISGPVFAQDYELIARRCSQAAPP